MSGAKRLPGWLTGLFVGATFLGLLVLERRRPLRRSVESKFQRNARNFAVAALGAAALQVAEMPVVNPLSTYVEKRRWGLLKVRSLPLALELLSAVALLDYTLYLWHILLHKVPLLWRCHQPHHVDLDMDASTALRFHFAELVASVPWRVGQVAVIGVSPLALSIWQTATLMEVMFHHSNLELPIEVERWLNKLVVTPRMHGIHHSIVPEEQNANWSSGLAVWDWLHGTLRLHIPQDEITVGVPAYQDPKEITLPHVLAMPFTEQRPSWELPRNGMPTRAARSASANQLLA
jgi:sterol desaturase/sphingolipid hydroxylase (fatty acid hydroxylase superfamily)